MGLGQVTGVLVVLVMHEQVLGLTARSVCSESVAFRLSHPYRGTEDAVGRLWRVRIPSRAAAPSATVSSLPPVFRSHA